MYLNLEVAICWFELRVMSTFQEIIQLFDLNCSTRSNIRAMAYLTVYCLIWSSPTT